VTRHYLCGLEVVWPNGEVSRLGGKTIKNVTGYDLPQLLCGSEGTLGIITEITLRLIPRPACSADLLIPFPSVAAAVQACTAVIANKIIPATMELMERKALLAAEAFLGKKAPFREAEAHLLVQLDGPDQAALAAEYENIGKIVADFGALDVLVAEDRPSRDRIWEMRRCMSDALTKMSPIREREDVVVPRASIPALFERLGALSKTHGVEIICYGHIGDGNVHVNVMKGALPLDDWERLLPALLESLFREVVTLGGTISGEHGIGCVKKKFLPLALDPAAIAMMKAIKRAVDPDDILNPGKIFP
jgi:glycolate oxidase